MKGLTIIVLFFSFSLYSHEKFDLIVDTDMAMDDWAALLYVLNKKENAQIKGITLSGNGETHCNKGISNLLDIINLAGRSAENIPVACGDEVPIEGLHTYPDAWRVGVDTLYGVEIPQSSQKIPAPIHAVELLKNLIRGNQEKVVILTLGSLTNLAQLLEKYPDTKSKIKRIFIMGGAVEVKGNLKVKGVTENLKNEFAEWNIWIDPIASQKVFRSGVPITLVPLDATNHVLFTKEIATLFDKNSTSKGAKFYNQVLKKNSWLLDTGEYYFWDPFAAAAIFSPVCATVSMSLDVEASFDVKATVDDQLKDFSQTFASGVINQYAGHLKNRKVLNTKEAGRIIKIKSAKPNVEACIGKIDSQLFIKDFIETINKF